MEHSDINVLILAGQRAGVVDPLCEDAGVQFKALLPIFGKPMLAYVLETLDQCPSVKTPFWITGLDKNLIRPTLHQSPSEAGPAASILAAAQSGLTYPFMVTSCDHPLLTPDMVESFLSKAHASGADFAVGLAKKSIVQTAYPTTKRTYLKFKGAPVSGCNLFYIRNENGLAAIEFWLKVQNERKKPFKLARRVSLATLFQYLAGRLTLEDAFARVSKALNIKVRPVILPFAQAAIDVDKPSDLALVTTILSGRT